MRLTLSHMRVRWVLAGSLCGLLWMGAGVANAQETLYAATTDYMAGGNLYVLDPTTAAATLVGPLLVGTLPIGVTGLAFNPANGTLYGVTDDYSANYPDSLVTINTQTAAATLIGPLGVTSVTDISFNSAGMLYGWVVNPLDPASYDAPSSSYLVSISLTTGAATQIGSAPMGLNYEGGIAFSPGGTLYVENNVQQSSGCCSPYPSPFVFETVDPTTGNTTPVSTSTPFGDSYLDAMAFNAAGTLFIVVVDSDGFSSLYTVDPTTGNVHSVGDLVDPVFNAIAFSPSAAAPNYLIRYVTNLNLGDSVVDITNDGSSSSNLCVGVYFFDPNEELQSCCACEVTPNGLISLSVKANNLNNLTGELPNSEVVKLLAWTATSSSTATGTTFSVGAPINPAPGAAVCNAAAPGTLAGGAQAWGTTLHATPGGSSMTETPFARALLSTFEYNRLTNFCSYNQFAGSGNFGQCVGCKAGGF